MVSEYRAIYGIEMWGLDRGLNETDQIHSRFCQIILGVATLAANSVAELELGRVSRRGVLLSTIVKYRLLLSRVNSEEIVRTCYEWQVNNLKAEGRTKELKKGLKKKGL
jgi:hypothetical protein